MNAIFLSRRRDAAGFTLIEVLIVLGIMGIFMLVSYPSIMNTMAARNLDNSTREIQTFMQQTKLRAVDTKIVHRVRFYLADEGYWVYEMERLQMDGTWVRARERSAQGHSEQVKRHHVPARLRGRPYRHLLPRRGLRQLRRQPELHRPPESQARPAGQMDERVLSLFMGGSIHYAKRKST